MKVWMWQNNAVAASATSSETTERHTWPKSLKIKHSCKLVVNTTNRHEKQLVALRHALINEIKALSSPLDYNSKLGTYELVGNQISCHLACHQTL